MERRTEERIGKGLERKEEEDMTQEQICNRIWETLRIMETPFEREDLSSVNRQVLHDTIINVYDTLTELYKDILQEI